MGSWENNVYVVVCLQTKRSLIVDAAAEAATIIDLAAGSTPQAILTTHGHVDHIGAAADVADHFSIPILLHGADADGRLGAEPLQPGPVEIGDVVATVLSTPGHTPGSVCVGLPGIVLSGDTLFPGGPGATGGPGSSFAEIVASIESVLFTLPGETLVAPGHGLDTTIGDEAPQLGEWVARGW